MIILNVLRTKINPTILVAFLLIGCNSINRAIPFDDPIRGKEYSISNFDAWINEQQREFKKSIEEMSETKNNDENKFGLSPFPVWQFPSIKEWQQIQENSESDDLIVEYHNHAYMRHGYGPREEWLHGYALERDGEVLFFIFSKIWSQYVK